VVIRQGDVFWLERPTVSGSGQHGRRPHLVIQNELINGSAIGTILVCPLTTNIRRARARGNVLLQLGDANLSQTSVVNVSQTFAADRTLLTERIGAVSRSRVREMVDGLKLLIEPFDMPSGVPTDQEGNVS